LLLLTVPNPRVVHQAGIHFQRLRYLDLTLAAYVGETMTIRYDSRDLAEIRVYHGDQFICHAICQELVLDRSPVRRILLQAGLASPRPRRAPQHRSRRERMPQAGLLLQADGSRHRWHSTSIGTGASPRAAAPLTLEEELAGGRLSTQVGRVLEELGIRPIFALSPQAKARVERLWGTLQDRLVQELRLHGVGSLPEANQELGRFLPRFNTRLSVPPAQPGSA
jgi:hypothetical protein